MDGLTALHAFSPVFNAKLYTQGNAFGWLAKGGKTASAEYQLSGRLYAAKSGWLLLSVPNALVRGVFDAITAPGVELPLAGAMNVPNVDKDLLNAHISVMTAAEVEKIGADNITERGQSFSYTLGSVREVSANNIDGVSKLWLIEVASPGLSALRKSYGLSALPKDQPFHITVAIRRTKVLGNNSVSKGYETYAEPTEGHSFRNPLSRGELKAASSDTTTYDCCCSGPCMCPDTCVCRKHGACHSVKAASRIPAREISQTALAEGAKHEHEHTSNDQIARKVAKDHLQEDAADYKKIEKIEKAAAPKVPSIILRLREAKAHSDNKRYDRKNAILQMLMSEHPADWYVDDPLPKHMGVTHAPTNFRFHADPAIIPVGVKVRAKAAKTNPYAAQLAATPVQINRNDGLWQNFMHHLRKVKQRGDWQLQAEQNSQGLLAELNPAYKQQLQTALARGQYPQHSTTTQVIQRHGDNILSYLGK